MLAPSLHELESELAGKFELLKVDVDRDRPVAEYMNIAAMPTLVLYKDGEIQWRNEGLVPKELVAEKINGAQ
jgi:thioredoxin 1